MDTSDYKLKNLTARVCVFIHSTNIGIIESKSGLYVIDSGATENDGLALYEAVKNHYPQKKIIALINTHSHSDHAGGNAAFIKEAGCKLWAPQAEAFLLENPAFISDLYWGGSAFDELKTDRYRCMQSVKTDFFIDGKTVELDENCTMSFVPLYGHYYSHTGILIKESDSKKSVFFVGDGLFGKELIAKTWLPFLMNPHEFRESVDKIEATPADYYIPSHGLPYTPQNISCACEMNTILTLEAENLITKLLRVPRTQETLLKEMLDYAGIRARLAQFIWIGTTMRSYLADMEKRGIIEHYISDNCLYWRTK